MALEQRPKQSVKISNREASDERSASCTACANIQRQSGVIKKNNLDVGGMRRKTFQSSRAALMEQPKCFPQVSKCDAGHTFPWADQSFSETENPVYDILHSAWMRVGR